MKPVWLLLHVFVSFFGPNCAQPCTTFNSIPIMNLILLANRNIALIYSVTICEKQQRIVHGQGKILRPRPHVSGDFCIRKFFYADTKISASTRSVYESYTTVHTYPIRIRTSQRISQQSMENLARKKTGSDTVTSAYTKIYGYERPHVHSVYRNFHSGKRIQKSPDTPSV